MQGFAPATDLAELHSTMRAIEQACTSIQMHINPGASEAVILSLGQSSQPYKTCQFILENSLVATARFQAAAAIREAAIREWGFLSSDDKRGLISFCLCYVMQHASSPDGYVQAKVSSVATQLMKRGWLEFVPAEKEALFYQVNQAILGIHGIDVQFAGIKFLESLVSEFSPSTSSAMGLPREFHEQCRRSLERDYLKTFYRWTQEAASSVTNRIIESDSAVPEVKVCTVALDLMLQILNWDFRSNNSDTKINVNVFSAGVRQDGDSVKRSECHLVQPGSDWCDVLILSGHVGWLLSLYAALRPKFSCEGYWLDCPIAVSSRKLVVQFCSLTGTVFPSDDGKMHEQHLLQLLSGIIEWIDPPDVISKAIENGKSDRPIGTLTFLSMLISEVIKVLMNSNTEEETWSWEARDVLLDTWTAILLPINTINVNALLPSEGIKAAANLFGFIVEWELRLASATAFNDEGDSDYLHASVSGLTLVNTPLDGHNYGEWSRSMCLSLSAKNKFGLIDGTVKAPLTTDPRFPLWQRCNDLVITWILHSIQPDIARSVIFSDTAVAVWSDLHERFSQGVESRIYQIRQEIAECRQGSLSVSAYYTKLKGLWDELGSYQEPIACKCNMLQQVAIREEKEKVMQFLMGLNESYSQVRGSILMMSPLPDTRKVHGLILQQERQMEVAIRRETSSTSHVMQITHTPTPSSQRKKLQCTHCEQEGHSVERCYYLIGFPVGHKWHGKNVKPRNKKAKAHNVEVKKEPTGESPAFTAEEYKQLMALLRDKNGNDQTPTNTTGRGYEEDDWPGQAF